MSGCADPFGRPSIAPQTEVRDEPEKSRSRLLVSTANIRTSIESWLPNCSSSR
jgi:hypothetical protein